MRKVSIPTDDVDITSLVYPERISPSIRSRFLLFDAAAIVEWNSELVAIQTADARDRIALSADLGLAGVLLRLRNAVTARTNRSCELRRLASWSSVQFGADLVHLANVARRRRRDYRAAPLFLGNDPLGLQTGQRFADRRSADGEFFSQRFLLEANSRRIFARGNLRPYLGRNFFNQLG